MFSRLSTTYDGPAWGGGTSYGDTTSVDKRATRSTVSCEKFGVKPHSAFACVKMPAITTVPTNKRHTMASSSLLPIVLDALDKRPYWLALKDIAKDTGISADWLGNLAARRIKSPGVDRIETLYTYFTGDDLSAKVCHAVEYPARIA